MMRIALFVDAANMFYAQRDNGWEIDYKKVYKYFTKGRDVAWPTILQGLLILKTQIG